MCLAIPAKLLGFQDETRQLGMVEVSGVRRQVNLMLLAQEALKPGDWVLIHVGFAMSKISEEMAHEQLRTLHLLGEANAALDELEGYQFAEEEQRPDAPS